MSILVEPFYEPGILLIKVFHSKAEGKSYAIGPGVIWPKEIKEGFVIVGIIAANRELISLSPVVKEALAPTVVRHEVEKYGKTIDLAVGDPTSEVTIRLRK